MKSTLRRSATSGFTRAFAASLIAVASFASCGPSTPSRGASKPSLIILISVDTCRADRLGCYGARLADGSSPTPVIDRLAAAGVVYPHALTPAPLTLPAHTTMMSGLYPDRHGVRENDSFRVPRREARRYALLAEELRDAGFECAAFVSAQPMDRRFGLGAGFRVYDDVDRESAKGGGLAFRERSGEATTDRAVAWLKADDRTPKRFLFLHLFEPHRPYERRPDAPAGLPVGVEGDYLAEIAEADRVIGKLIAALPDGGAAAWVCVVSDHGEGLGENGEATHGYFLHDATLRVPLIIKPPRGVAVPKARPARLVDLRATLLDAAGVAGEPRDGESLLKPPTAEFRDRAEALYGFYQHRYARLRAIRDATCKLVEGGGRETLSHWSGDGSPASDIACLTEAARLRALLFEALSAAGAEAAEGANSTPELSGAYHGARSESSSVEPGEDENRLLPRADDRLETIRDLDEARARLASGEPAKAALILRARAAERDGNPALLLWTGRAIREAAADERLPLPVRIRELDEARALFSELGSRWRDVRGTDLELLCLRDRWRLSPDPATYEEAIRKASAEIVASGGTALTWGLRGLARAEAADLAGAESDLRRARELDPADVRISVDLARIVALRGIGEKGR